MIFGPLDYLKVMEKLRLFSTEHPVPDCNSLVWREYFRLYQAHVGPLDRYQIVCTPGGLGFYKDPLEEDIESYAWALLGPISHPTIPLTAEQVFERARDIFETFLGAGLPVPSIQTETFDFINTPAENYDNNFIWVSSPRARLSGSFDDYAASLSAPRRKQMRRLFRIYDEDPRIRFDFSARPLDHAEIDFVIEHSHRRWGKDWAYALIQSLWTIAVSTIMPDRARFMRVYNDGQLAFINTYIVRDHAILSQSTCRNEDLFMSGLGVMIDFKAIQMLSGNTKGLTHLDPTCCICAVDYYEHISVAKREVVNEDHAKPLFMAGIDLPALDHAYPHLDPAKGWVTTDRKTLVGKAA